jgi:hypothetical protein
MPVLIAPLSPTCWAKRRFQHRVISLGTFSGEGAGSAVSGRREEEAAGERNRSILALAQLLQGASECLAAREHGPEQVAVLFDPLERFTHPEAARRYVLR